MSANSLLQMRHNLFPVALLTVILLFSACKENDLNSTYNTYRLVFQVENADGENLVQGISVGPTGGVLPDDYSLEGVPGSYEGAPLQVIGEGDKTSLLWRTSIDGPEFQQNLEFRLYCRYIFGNTDWHTITTHWTKDGSLPVCNRMTFDGVELPLFTPDPEESYLKGVKITVNRQKEG